MGEAEGYDWRVRRPFIILSKVAGTGSGRTPYKAWAGFFNLRQNGTFCRESKQGRQFLCRKRPVVMKHWPNAVELREPKRLGVINAFHRRGGQEQFHRDEAT